MHILNSKSLIVGNNEIIFEEAMKLLSVEVDYQFPEFAGK